MSKFVLILEAPDERFPRYIGPFETNEAAWQYAQGWAAGIVVEDTRMKIGTGWHVASLEAPGEWLKPWHEFFAVKDDGRTLDKKE